MPLVRWTDERLDDLAARVNALIPLLEEFARIGERTRTTAATAETCLLKLERLEQHLEDRDTEQARERKSDRRWMVATVLTVTAIVVAALGVFLG